MPTVAAGARDRHRCSHTRVASRNWYLLATGEGEKERLRIVTLAAADDRWLYVVKTAYGERSYPSGEMAAVPHRQVSARDGCNG